MNEGAEIGDAGPKPVLAWLPVSSLSVDERYQRDLESRASKTLIKSIVENFRWDVFGTIVAVKHGGGWRIIDGQHRVEAARRRSEPAVPAVVIESMSVEDQARIFVRANRDRVAMNPFAMYHAQLAAQEPSAVELHRMCDELGLTIPRYPLMASQRKAGQTLALSTLAKIRKSLGRDRAELAIGAVAKAYRAEPVALRANLFKAVAGIIAAADMPEDTAWRVANYLCETNSKLLYSTARIEMASMLVSEQMALERVVKRGISGRVQPARITAPEAPLQVDPLNIKPRLPDGHRLMETPSQILDRRAYDEDRFRRLVRSGAPADRIAAAFKITETEVARLAALL